MPEKTGPEKPPCSKPNPLTEAYNALCFCVGWVCHIDSAALKGAALLIAGC
jgi:hypothetical protein